MMRDPSHFESETLDAPRGEGPGGHIGPYRILQQIGEGSFGAVFEADQEHPVKRRVALKIIKLGMDSQQVVARFEAERQALAIMDHPHIARVFDAGATTAGRPYFVMELVRGEPISIYCDKHKLSIINRLTLFDQVCVAVQHAHTKGIIHRDLKPSNVMVSTEDDRPFAKVIDFGIAKATSNRLTDRTLFTAHHQIVGTPLYMSPEQIEGSADIDTRTDIYSLGVLFYELLTGTTPVASDTLRADIVEVQRVIREVIPPRPSVRLSQSVSTLSDVAARRGTEPRILTAMIRGDLDWIVLKAIEKDRTRRYETANALAADVRRYLAGEPVLAVPPSASYRLRKFVRRHKGAVAAGLLVAAALVLGIIGTTIGMVRAERQRRAAEKVASFMTDILSGVGPSIARGRDTAMMKEMMSLAADRIEKGELRDAPEVEIELRQSIGRTQTELAEFDAADRLLKPAVDMARDHYGTQSAKVSDGLYALAELRRDQGEYQEAEALHRQALEMRRRGLGPRTIEVADSLGSLAATLTLQDKLTEAEGIFREAIPMYRELHATETRGFSDQLGNFAMTLRKAGKLAEAEEAYREALGIVRRVLGDTHPDLVIILNNLAVLLRHQGKPLEAEAMLRESLAMSRRLYGEEHPNIAGSLHALAAALLAQDKNVEAELLLREALAMMRKVAGDDHINVGRTLASLASALMRQGKSVEAEPLAREAVAIADRVLSGSEDAARFRVTLGRVLTALGRFSAAEPILMEAYRIQEIAGIPVARRGECFRALVAMYSSWEKASPGRGYGANAREWQKRLDELAPANPAPAAAPPAGPRN